MTGQRRSARNSIAACIALSLAGLPGCQSSPAATSPEGEPLYILSGKELHQVFRNVGVFWSGVEPGDRSRSESFFEDGLYVSAGTGDLIVYFRREGVFWVENGQLCRRNGSGDAAFSWCMSFGRSPAGMIYELPPSPKGRPVRYDLKPLPEQAFIERKQMSETGLH